MSNVHSDEQADPAAKPAEIPKVVEDSSLLRQLFFERYFRAAVLLVALAFISAAILLPKMVRSTPKGFLPVINVRWLDKIQAWSLARSARSAEAAGQLDSAVLAWRSAIANDPGDNQLSRSLVRLIATQPIPPRKYLNVGATHALWLLRLTETNRADLDLAATLFARYHLDQYVAVLLRPVETNLSLVQAREYLKALFNLGYMEPFNQTWERYPEATAGDTDLALYRAAWEAGWGPPATLRSGAAQLAEGTRAVATTVLANRLSLAVAFSRADITAYEQALAVLIDRHEDRVADHLQYWRLLLNAGQRERAGQLARAYSNPPDSPADALLMTDIFLELGLVEYAAEFLEKQLHNFNFSAEVWQRQADLYLALKRWSDLRTLAVYLRASERIPPDLNGFAWFLEGIAELKAGRTDLADTAFARAIDFPPNNPLMTYRMATMLNQLDQHEHASALLGKLETEFGGLAVYWFQVVRAAYQARQFDIMRAAASRGYELATNDPIFINNYAAALLIERTNAPLAIQLTLRRLSQEPTSVSARLNHALALLQNDRLDDAEAELARINPERLDSYYHTVLQLGYFELNVRRQRRQEALLAYQGIEARFLMPPQIRWLEAKHREISRQRGPASRAVSR